LAKSLFRKLAKQITLDNKILIKAFILGALIRGIAEIVVGKYPIGYDPNTWYIYMCVCNNLRLMLLGILYPLMLQLMYLLFGNAIIAVKLCSVLVSGLFLFSLVFWGVANNIDYDVALDFGIAMYSFYVILRIIWDLHRNVVGLCISLIALAYYKRGAFKKAFFLGILAGLAHPFDAIFIGAALFMDIIRKNFRALSIVIGTTLAVLLLGVLNSILTEFPNPISIALKSNSSYVSKEMLPIYIIWLYFPVLPLLLNVKHNFVNYIKRNFRKRIINSFSLWIITILIAAFIFNFSYRIVFLAAFPIMFVVFNRIHRSYGRKAVKYLILYNIIVAIVYPLIFYIYPINPAFRRTHPPVLLAGNMFPHETYAAERLFRKAYSLLNNSSVIIVHHSEIAYAYGAGIPLCSSQVIITGPDDTFDEYLELLSENLTYHFAYIVWYVNALVGSCKAPTGGQILEREGNIALFRYDLSIWKL